jgi:hypothetical protein
MRFLIDTNIFLEIILDQLKADEAKSLLSETEKHDFYISDFSLHSIGLILFRRNQYQIFQQFVNDMMINAGMMVLSLSLEDMASVIRVAQKFKLDFDDSYQYALTEKHKLVLVSFDADFDRTDQGKVTPIEIL